MPLRISRKYSEFPSRRRPWLKALPRSCSYSRWFFQANYLRKGDTDMAEAVAAAGVEKLVSRLREDGVKAGQQQADHIIQEAESRAARIIADAQNSAAQ